MVPESGFRGRSAARDVQCESGSCWFPELSGGNSHEMYFYREWKDRQRHQGAGRLPANNGYHPLINYNATRSDGSPILKMLDANKKIVYTDLTAMITGPN